jgi:hypothetical protein
VETFIASCTNVGLVFGTGLTFLCSATLAGAHVLFALVFVKVKPSITTRTLVCLIGCTGCTGRCSPICAGAHILLATCFVLVKASIALVTDVGTIVKASGSAFLHWGATLASALVGLAGESTSVVACITGITLDGTMRRTVWLFPCLATCAFANIGLATDSNFAVTSITADAFVVEMLCAVRTIHRLSICAHTIIVSALLAIDAIFCPETSIAFCTDGGTVHFACGTCCCSAASAFADVLFTLLFDNAEASIAPDTVVILVLGTRWSLHFNAIGTSALVRLALLALHVRTSMAAPTHDSIVCGTSCALQCFATNASADVWRARV